jgi:hypothetical protein
VTRLKEESEMEYFDYEVILTLNHIKVWKVFLIYRTFALLWKKFLYFNIVNFNCMLFKNTRRYNGPFPKDALGRNVSVTFLYFLNLQRDTFCCKGIHKALHNWGLIIV